MNPLQAAIQLMSKEEIRAFKLHAQKVQVKGRRKDIELFDLVRQDGDDYNESRALNALYGANSTNTFHRLKSRLLAEVNRSQVALHLERNDTLKLYHFLSVVELYFWKRHFNLAHWFLRKAEKIALKLGNYVALDIILNGYIRLSHEVLDIDPQPYIERRRENRATLARIQDLDDVLAMAIHRVNVTQNYGTAGSEIMNLLQDTVSNFAADASIQSNPTFRFKLFDAISRIMLDRRDYQTLEVYVKATFAEFEGDDLFKRNTHDRKLQMLIFIINALHKNGKPEESLRYVERLKVEMDLFQGALKSKYLFFYYNSMVINYFEVDVEKAITVLEEMERSASLVEIPFYELFIHMNLALAWHDQGNLNKAIRYIVGTQLLDGYKTAAAAIKLRIAAAELIIRYKLGQYDVIVSRARQFKNDYKSILKTSEFEREHLLVRIIARMNEVIDPKEDKRTQNNLMKFQKIEVDQDTKDGELMDYDAFVEKYRGVS